MADVLLQVEINGFLSFVFIVVGDKFAELKQGREFVISQFRSFQKKERFFDLEIYFYFLGGGKNQKSGLTRQLSDFLQGEREQDEFLEVVFFVEHIVKFLRGFGEEARECFE